MVKVFTQLDPPKAESEKVSTKDLPVLDNVTITKVTDFMQKFQADATFSPPTIEVLFDSDDVDNISVDDDVDSVFIDIEEMDDVIQRAREESK